MISHLSGRFAMLDARFVRENTDAVRSALAHRGSAWDVEGFLALDERRREHIGELENRQARRNEASKAIGGLMKDGKRAEAEELKSEVRTINEHIAVLEKALSDVDDTVNEMLLTIPNLPDAGVPVGTSEDDNVEVRRWGTPPSFDFEAMAHWDLGPELGVVDFERGVKLAKSRFVVLGRDGARLNRALINFMLDTHGQRGYTEWSVPALANAETLTGTGQLPKFADDLFTTGEGLYLIPTAEVQLTN
ncbi:MAG: serine--tRNA ligase, partial [Actinomycetota bacterium]|nr:serine--tRNA ligase [Actinomycetota bacterium]